MKWRIHLTVRKVEMGEEQLRAWRALIAAAMRRMNGGEDEDFNPGAGLLLDSDGPMGDSYLDEADPAD